jgi:hypothetical protein
MYVTNVLRAWRELGLANATAASFNDLQIKAHSYSSAGKAINRISILTRRLGSDGRGAIVGTLGRCKGPHQFIIEDKHIEVQ